MVVGVFFPSLLNQAVLNQCQGQGWGRGDEGVAGQPGLREQRGYIRFFNIPAGMVVRRGRRHSIRQPALHMSQRIIFPSSKGL